ncbi:transposable element Tcb2 transposase [Trichonephila clavipes]|nr:transposable element Tcb2 transposase [Trichonephila clavipes]
MGGVDSHDWLLEKHTIKICGKNWYWLIFTRIVDMAVVNTCVIYNMVNIEKKSIKEIRKHIAIAYLKKGNTVQKQIGRPSYTISSRVKKIDTVRYDGVGHIIELIDVYGLWRQPHESMDLICQPGIAQADGGSIMVGGVCSWCDMVPLIRPDTTLIGDRWTLWKFQQDIATPHTSRIATYWLTVHSSEFRHFRWSPKSPDMNLIERICLAT